MTLQQYILDYLMEQGYAPVPNFGEFSVKDSAAFFDSKSSTLLPPRKEILFQVNYENSDKTVLNEIATKSNQNISDVESELKKLTDYWKKHLNENKELETEEFGKFYISEDKLFFKGKRLDHNSEENYGLEEINISQLTKQKLHAENKIGNDYKFNNSILWLFLLIIPVAGLLFLGMTQSDIIFGKKSFQNITVKNATHRIEKDNPKKDSLQRILKDSVKADSIKKHAPVPAKRWTKWAKHKKYKWRNVKKRANR